jgi:hypothetical protein
MQDFKIYQSLIDHATANGLFKKAEQLIQVQNSMLNLQKEFQQLQNDLKKERELKKVIQANADKRSDILPRS